MIAFISGCSSDNVESSIEPHEKSIDLPVLLEFPQNGELIDTTRQLESITYPLLISKEDSIEYKSLNPFEKYYYFPDSIEYSKSNNLELIVDPKQAFTSKFWEKMPFDYLLTYVDDNGIEIPRKQYTSPYDQVIKIPVFIVNNSDSAQVIEHHDGRLVMIQEALDKKGNWVAIEYFEFSGCGNSFGLNLIPQNQFMMFGINKYNGHYKTKLRVRLKTNGKTLISNEFHGSINENQFEEVEARSGFGWNRYLNEEGY